LAKTGAAIATDGQRSLVVSNHPVLYQYQADTQPRSLRESRLRGTLKSLRAYLRLEALLAEEARRPQTTSLPPRRF
ncbi:MAG: hypothetical protein VYC71_07815, partial [Planctomycetota bacterium]|nr:hypothetical protein [Planctomycetota bacterium]